MGHFRAGLGDYLDRVFFLNQTFLITRNRIPFARIKPVPIKNKPKEKIDAIQIRKDISHILGRVHYGETDLLVLRRGKPVAVLKGIPPKEDSE